jgi:hypothetical protein
MTPELDARSRAQEVIKAAWQEIFGLTSVGVDENFFDLGGNSVHVIQVLAKLRAGLNVQIEPLDLFRYPTIRSLLDAWIPEQAPAPFAESPAMRAEKHRKAIKDFKKQLNTRR